MSKKKIAVITGTRAEYGYWKEILKLLKNSPKVELFLIVAGMHLSKKYGSSYKQIERDGFKIYGMVKTDVGDSPARHTKIIAKTIAKMADIFDKIKPDLVLISGDPWPSFATAVTAAYMNIPLAHIQAGELSGNIDGVVRHAITKLTNVHFAANEDAAKRVEKLGEQKFRIYNVGAPLVDGVVKITKKDGLRVAKELNLDLKKPIIIVLQHPVSLEYRQAKKQMEETMKAIEELKYQTIVLYPNSEPGSKDMIKVINSYANKSYVKIFKNIPRAKYLGLLRIASVLVGNSSSGILEAPSYKIPVIEIGTRESYRLRASNIIDVKEHKKELILKAIRKALFDPKFRKKLKNSKNLYGDGKTSPRIARILENIKIDNKLRIKRMTY